MFDDLVADAIRASGAGAVAAFGRVENAACARRLAAMASMLDAAYAVDGSADRDQWVVDNVGAVGCHVGAALGLTSYAASDQLLIAVDLRDRFPKVAALFADGLLTYRLVRAIVRRGALVVGADALRALDTALAEAVTSWAPMSLDKTEQTIDALVDRVDPLAVIRRERRARSRYVDVVIEDGTGLATLSGTLFTPNAVAFHARLDALARTVCPADPRTLDQRRADAVGTVARSEDRLACLCGSQECPAGELPPSTGVIVYLVAHQDTVTGDSEAPPEPDAPVAPDVPDEPPGGQDPEPSTDPKPAPAASPAEECAALDGYRPLFATPLRDMTLAQALTEFDPGYLSGIRPAAMMGGAFLPGSVARRAALGAKLVPIVHPGLAPPEPRYTPSKRLADFVRCRDLTCRFPGCKVPATNCDVDHTIPWPYGPTQAANLKCLCRRHHLLKTFWSGEVGWRDRQHPNGTVDWTAPDGRSYTTTPGSRLLFPSLSKPTAPAVARPLPRAHDPGLKMPRRATTRAHDRAHRIHDERELNRIAAELEASERQANKDAAPEPAPPF